MAQNGQIVLSICKSCRRQLKISSKHSRAFTSTPQHQKTIPSFTPTANDELDDIFLTFRKKYFTPYALAKHHRDLMFKPSRSQILLNDPGVTVTMSDGEEVKLMPIHDKPSKHESLRRITELLGTSDDSKRWNNLPAFLEGMKLAKEQLPGGWLEKIVRKANEVGKTGVIIRCAEMVKKTGVCLADEPIARELMLGLHNSAADSGWEAEQIEHAVKKAEQVALMLEDELHCGGAARQGHDMRRNTCVLGTLLELRAAKAIKVDNETDVDGKVEGYVVKLLALWNHRPLEPSDRVERELEGWLPVWNGMRLALKIKDIRRGEHGEELERRLDELDKSVQEMLTKAREAAAGKPRRCLEMYSKLEGL